MPSTRLWLLAPLALAMLALAIGASLGARGRGTDACRGCNLIVVSMDTLRADHLGAYGYEKPTSPSIDRLASESVVFETAVSQSAWTRPAHLSMLTGLYPSEHGVVAVGDMWALPEDTPTLASVLASHGYAAAAFTGGANMSPEFGYSRGFRRFDASARHLALSVETVEEWLERQRSRRFFLLVHGFDAHRPYRSEPVDRVALGLDEDEPRGMRRACRSGSSSENIDRFIGAYDAAVHRGDRAVGRLLRTIDELGLRENTIVIFTSDHGEELFDHGGCFHIRTLYREVVNVPLIVRVPGLDPGRRTGVVPASVSLAPTALALLGFSDHPLPGPSLAARVLGHADGGGFAVSETQTNLRPGRRSGRVRSITTDRDKLVHWIDQDVVEYFDLEADPAELSPRDGGLRRRWLQARLGLWALRHGSREVARVPVGPSPRLERELRALGYAF